jgi:hypothetical protein
MAFLTVLCALGMYGCTTAGTFQSQNVTNVELSETNFEILAKNVSGRAYADFLLGISSSTGSVSSTLALARVGGSATLYNDALMDLWDNYEDMYGSTEGRNLVLANVRYDTDILNLIVFTKTTLIIHADVIEFR